MVPSGGGAAAGISPPPQVPTDPFDPHWALHPRTYEVRRTAFRGVLEGIDGGLDKDWWNGVPWSSDFDDIRGAADAPSPDDRPDAACRTRFKAIHDGSHLYIGAIVESDFETVATFEDRNSPIFQMDSDFEVFVDPVATCHSYKELEVNAINTVWNLMLDKPYDDGVPNPRARSNNNNIRRRCRNFPLRNHRDKNKRPTTKCRRTGTT